MNIKLTLGERLKDLRVERSLKLETLAEQTGLSKSALSKYESDDVTDLSIYAVTTLAEFYGVTTDYLLGVTENKKRPDAVLSDLHLSDGAVDVLRNGKFNHRLLCELIVHENFRRFLSISVEFCSFCTCFPTLWIYGTAAIAVLSYRQKENILTPQQRTY